MNLPEKIVNWSSDKNEWLKSERNISFEEIIVAIAEQDKLIDIYNEPINLNRTFKFLIP